MTDPIRASEVKPERVEWLWRERIPRGMPTIVGGRPDQGKGLFCAYLAAEVSRTKYPNLDGTKRWGQVLYSAIEDSHGLMTAPRLKAAGARMSNVHLWRFQIPSMLVELEAIIRAKKIDLLIMDPFAAHLSSGISRHSDSIRQVLNPLTELIEETRTAVVVVEHVLKRTTKNSHPLAAIGGSGSGLPAAARMAFLFGTDPVDEDRRILAAVKANIRDLPQAVAFEIDTAEVEVNDSEMDVPFLLFDKEIDFDPLRLVVVDKDEGKVGRPPDKRAAAAEWLTNYLYNAGQPIPGAKVIEDAKHFGMSQKTLRRAKTDMKIIVNPPGGGRNATWELPESTIKTLEDAFEEGRPKSYVGKSDIPGVEGFDDDETAVITDADLAALLGEDENATFDGDEDGDGE